MSSPKNNLEPSPHEKPTDDGQRQLDLGSSDKAVDIAQPWKRSNPLKYSMQSFLQQGKALLTPRGSSQSLSKNGFTTAKDATALFPAVDPAIDGEDCLHDCASCTVDLPRKWSIDEDDKLYGHVNGWESHIVVATGKTDWVRDIADEKGSLMEKIAHVSNKGKQLQYNGRSVMMSASDMPTGDDGHDDLYAKGSRTKCLVLPSWRYVENVSTEEVDWMMMEVVSKSSSITSPMDKQTIVKNETGTATPDTDGEGGADLASQETPRPLPALSLEPPQGVHLRACPHRAIILMCSHKTRDWRCGASAPLLRKEFERHLRPLGLYRDMHDERPGGVGIYFINHVGGHKYSANVMIYRREGRERDGDVEASLSDEAVQGIWLARVRPEDCENIVKYTVLQGKLVKPQRQLRGGFDRECGLTSW